MSTEYFEAKNLNQLCALLGLPASQAPKVGMRRDLVIAIRRAVESNKYTHAAAAKITKVGRTVITAIMNGNIERISTDRLIDVAYALGLNVRLRVEREKKPVRLVKAAHGRSRVAALR